MTDPRVQQELETLPPYHEGELCDAIQCLAPPTEKFYRADAVESLVSRLVQEIQELQAVLEDVRYKAAEQD